MENFPCANNGSKVLGSTSRVPGRRHYRAQLLANSTKPMTTIATMRITPKPPQLPDDRMGSSFLFGAHLFGDPISIGNHSDKYFILPWALHRTEERTGINLHQ